MKRKEWKRFTAEWQQEIQQRNDQVSWHRDEVKRLQPLSQESDSAGEAQEEIQEEADAIGLMKNG